MEPPLITPDLVEMLDFQPGQILMRGQRFLLINADALGMLRHDLVSTLGRERAKGFLLRYGWSCGHRDALAVKEQFQGTSDLLLQKQGPIHHMVEGIVRVEIVKMEVDLKQDRFFFEGSWTNSYEAQQHQRHFGVAEDPVCWSLVGYAGGYSSGLFDRRILYKETSCVGKGDDHCRFVGQTVEAWGDEIQDELPYYEQSMIGQELEEAYRHIQEQNDLLRQIMRIHEELNDMVLAGVDRQEIIETVGQLLDAPVVVEDRYRNVLASWLPPNCDVKLSDCMLERALVRNASLKSTLEQIDQELRIVDWVPVGGSRDLARTIAPMVLGRQVVGYLSVVHMNEHANPQLVSMIVERAAAAMEIDLLRERTKVETELRLGGEFLDVLLDDSSTVASLENRAHFMGYDFERPHRLLLVAIDPPYSVVKTTQDQDEFLQLRKDLMHFVRSLISAMQTTVMVVERPTGVLILTRVEQGVDSIALAREISAKQRNQSQPLSVSICVSDEFMSIEQLRGALQDCQNTLDVMRRLGRYGDIFLPKDVDVFDLLYASPSQGQLRSYAQRQVADLLQYDEQYGGELAQTLYAYLDNECNLQRTLRVLNISLSGLKYRLQRVREIGQVNLDDANTRFSLQLSLRILLASGSVTFKTVGGQAT